jgi:heat shock protein HtpX
VRALLFLGYVVWAAFTIRQDAVGGALATLFWLDMTVVSIRMASLTGTVVWDRDTATRVAPMVRELCEKARCIAPRVMLRSDARRAAGVRRGRRGGRPTLILSVDFARRVDDNSLRAVLAHEVVHIVRGDLRAARVRSLVAFFVGGLAGGVAAVATDPSGHGVPEVPAWAAAFGVGLLLTLAVLSPLNRPRETRADLEGAALCGDPAALARGLGEAHRLSAEVRQRLLGPLALRILLAPVAWRLPTHPPMPRRIADLEAAASRAA